MLRVAALHPWQILLGEESDIRPGAVQRAAVRRYTAISEQGPAWQPGVLMREQRMWPEHASAMNAMAEEHFVRLGGPLESTDNVHRALLIIEAESARRVRARLGRDPWTAAGILRIADILAWTILLGDLVG